MSCCTVFFTDRRLRNGQIRAQTSARLTIIIIKLNIHPSNVAITCKYFAILIVILCELNVDDDNLRIQKMLWEISIFVCGSWVINCQVEIPVFVHLTYVGLNLDSALWFIEWWERIISP